MFSLRIHSVDTHHLLTLTSAHTGGVTTIAVLPNPNPKIQECRGIVHLYRHLSHHSTSPQSTSQASALLFLLAVPSHFSSDDFLRFCGSHSDHVTEVVLIRNDAMEDRYSVLMKFVDQERAQSFYRNFNGRRFSSTEAEVCHILFTVSVEYTEVTEFASTPPPGCTELPTCPVCLERLDQDTSGILTTLCDHSFQCPCISKWTDSFCSVCRSCQQQAEKPTCSICGTIENLWICLICGFIGCGRYKERHAIQHWKDTQHCYSLDLETQRVWDYVGDNHVHRLNQSKTDGKLSEFNSHCSPSHGDCGSCEWSKESGISGALLNSKVEAIVDEYNHLLTSQLENQRQYYEKLLVEAKGKRQQSISEAVEKALNLKLQEIQLNIDKCIEENKVVASTNESLLKDQKSWQKKVKEIEERQKTELKLKHEKILDLKEQVRDLTVYLEAQKTVGKMIDADDIKGGTVVGIPSEQSNSGGNNAKRRTKTNRRHN